MPTEFLVPVICHLFWLKGKGFFFFFFFSFIAKVFVHCLCSRLTCATNRLVREVGYGDFCVKVLTDHPGKALYIQRKKSNFFLFLFPFSSQIVLPAWVAPDWDIKLGHYHRCLSFLLLFLHLGSTGRAGVCVRMCGARHAPLYMGNAWRRAHSPLLL